MRKRSDTFPSTSQENDRDKFIRANSSPSQDSPNNVSHEVRGLTLSAAARKTNIYIQAMENLLHKDDLENACVSSTSSDSTDADSFYTTVSENDDNQPWQDAFDWNLDSVSQLRDMLRIWVEGNMPADEIGDFLTICLLNRDDHLDNRLTRMVNDRETYEHIAIVILEYLQVRDEDNNPLWTNLASGDIYRRPGDVEDEDLEDEEFLFKGLPYESLHDETLANEPVLHIAAPQPILPSPWRLFLSDLELVLFVDESPTDITDGSEDGSCASSYEDDELLLVRACHRAAARIGIIEHPEARFRPMTAEIFDFELLDFSTETDTDSSQGTAPDVNAGTPSADVGQFPFTW